MKTLRSLTFATTLCGLTTLVWTSSSRIDAQEVTTPPIVVDPAGKQAARDEWRRARELLASHTSIDAKLLETVSVLDRSFTVQGRYQQGNIKANDNRLRLELTLKVARSQGSILEICDGDVLWSRFEVGGEKEKKEPMITRRNVTQILDAARRKGTDPETQIVADMARGGLPALMAALDRNMDFTEVKAGTLREHSVKIVRGIWSEQLLKFWRDPTKPDAAPLLPSFVPDEVVISLDQATLFPLRIEYLKQSEKYKSLRPLLTLDFLNVSFDEPLNQGDFIFVPPDRQQPIEVTPAYLGQLNPPPAAAPK